MLMAGFSIAIESKIVHHCPETLWNTKMYVVADEEGSGPEGNGP
jgi:hypothetical protein